MNKKPEEDIENIIEENTEEDIEKNEQVQENKIDLLMDNLNKILDNSYKIKKYDKNLFNLKLEFFISLKEYIEYFKKIGIKLNVMENYDINKFSISISNIEFLLSILGDISEEKFKKALGIYDFLDYLEKYSLEKEIEKLDNNFLKVNIEENFKIYFYKFLKNIEVILENDNKILSEIDALKSEQAFNCLNEIYQESVILLSLTNSFIKYSNWLEALLDIIHEKYEKTTNVDINLKNMVEKSFIISEKILKNKVLDFDSDEVGNCLDEVLKMDKEIYKNYSTLINLDEVYLQSSKYLSEKNPHLDEQCIPFVSKIKQKEYIKFVKNLVEKLEKDVSIVLIQKTLNYLNLINIRNFSNNELEELVILLNKVNTKITQLQIGTRSLIKELEEKKYLNSEEKSNLQEYKIYLYWVEKFSKAVKKFFIVENDDKIINNDEKKRIFLIKQSNKNPQRKFIAENNFNMIEEKKNYNFNSKIKFNFLKKFLLILLIFFIYLIFNFMRNKGIESYQEIKEIKAETVDKVEKPKDIEIAKVTNSELSLAQESKINPEIKEVKAETVDKVEKPKDIEISKREKSEKLNNKENLNQNKISLQKNSSKLKETSAKNNKKNQLLKELKTTNININYNSNITAEEREEVLRSIQKPKYNVYKGEKYKYKFVYPYNLVKLFNYNSQYVGGKYFYSKGGYLLGKLVIIPSDELEDLKITNIKSLFENEIKTSYLIIEKNLNEKKYNIKFLKNNKILEKYVIFSSDKKYYLMLTIEYNSILEKDLKKIIKKIVKELEAN